MNIKVKMGQKELKRLTLRQLFSIEKGDMHSMVDLLSHFVQNEAGEPLEPAAGKEALLDLTIEDLEEVFKALQTAIQEGAVPPKNATSSNSQ